MTDVERSIVIGRDVIRSILATGDHARIFVGSHEPVAASYIPPWQIYDNLDHDRFVGRDWLVADFDEFVHTNQHGYFLLEADAGIGKTAFLAWLTRERGYVHHFVQLAPPGQEGIVAGLRNLAAQLVVAWELDADLVEAFPSAAALRPQFLPTVLRAAAQARDEHRPGEPIVVVVDGLDEAARLPGQNNLGLPRQLPPGVYVLVSQRPADVTLQVDTPRRVFRLAAEDAPNLQDMATFLREAALRGGVRDPSVFVETLLKRCRGVWIYLAYVIDEIEHGQRGLDALDDLPFGLWQYYEQQWRRWRDEHLAAWDATHLPLLAALGAADEALPFELLCDLAGVVPAPPRRLLEEHWRPFLTIRREPERRYGLFHASLRDFLHGWGDIWKLTAAEEAFLTELREGTEQAHRRIANHYLTAWGGLQEALPGLRDAAVAAVDHGYGLRHLTRHLFHTSPEDLHRLLAVEWVDEPTAPRSRRRSRNTWHTAAERAGDIPRYLNDIALAWRSAEKTPTGLAQGKPVMDLGRELRYALMLSSVNSVAANVPPPLVEALVEKGLWTVEQGLAYARRMPERWRAETLSALAGGLAEPAGSRALHEALAAARAIRDDRGRAETLAAIAPRLPVVLRDEAIDAARAIGHRRARMEALVALADGLPDPARTELFGDLVATTRSINDEATRTRALEFLAPRLPKSCLEDALATADTIHDASLRVRALAALAALVDEPARSRIGSAALAIAGTIEDESAANAAVATLAPFIGRSALGDILATVWSTEPETRRTEMLAALAPHLPGPLIAKAAVAVEAMTDESCRADALRHARSPPARAAADAGHRRGRDDRARALAGPGYDLAAWPAPRAHSSQDARGRPHRDRGDH